MLLKTFIVLGNTKGFIAVFTEVCYYTILLESQNVFL
jgi:hypothetical protein